MKVKKHTKPAASAVKTLSGRIDLAYPLPNNELAKAKRTCAEVAHDRRVNFSLCCYLPIQGSKMAKSLKDFMAIGEGFGRGDRAFASLLRTILAWE